MNKQTKGRREGQRLKNINLREVERERMKTRNISVKVNKKEFVG